jgi:hypothetical protein
LNQFVPKNCAAILTKLFNEPGCETIDDLAVFDLETAQAFCSRNSFAVLFNHSL